MIDWTSQTNSRVLLCILIGRSVGINLRAAGRGKSAAWRVFSLRLRGVEDDLVVIPELLEEGATDGIGDRDLITDF